MYDSIMHSLTFYLIRKQKSTRRLYWRRTSCSTLIVVRTMINIVFQKSKNERKSTSNIS